VRVETAPPSLAWNTARALDNAGALVSTAPATPARPHRRATIITIVLCWSDATGVVGFGKKVGMIWRGLLSRTRSRDIWIN